MINLFRKVEIVIEVDISLTSQCLTYYRLPFDVLEVKAFE
jgi:hypothetical protein